MTDAHKMMIADVLIHIVRSHAMEDSIMDIRLGLGYSAVCLRGGGVGICWSPKLLGHACSVFGPAGTLIGKPAAELASWLKQGENPWYRTIGLATVNALISQIPHAEDQDGDFLTQLSLLPTDRVVMVGRFQPLLKDIRACGCHLDIIEREPDEPDVLSPEQGASALANCTVALITATSLVTNTLDELLRTLQMRESAPRAVVLLGPSTPLLPMAFRGTPVTHLAGSRVVDRERVLQVVSQGGGTPQLKASLQMVTMNVPGVPGSDS